MWAGQGYTYLILTPVRVSVEYCLNVVQTFLFSMYIRTYVCMCACVPFDVCVCVCARVP